MAEPIEVSSYWSRRGVGRHSAQSSSGERRSRAPTVERIRRTAERGDVLRRAEPLWAIVTRAPSHETIAMDIPGDAAEDVSEVDSEEAAIEWYAEPLEPRPKRHARPPNRYGFED